jgi:ABC-2 type transport system permease protein
VSLPLSLGMTSGFLLLSLLAVWWMFRTGYRLKA